MVQTPGGPGSPLGPYEFMKRYGNKLRKTMKKKEVLNLLSIVVYTFWKKNGKLKQNRVYEWTNKFSSDLRCL